METGAVDRPPHRAGTRRSRPAAVVKTCRQAAFMLALNTAGCQANPLPDTGTSTATQSPTTAVPSALSLSDAVTCLAPEARLETFYDRTTLPEPAVDDYGLQGAGVVAEDFDGDGQVDLFIVGQYESQLWLNTTMAGQALSFVDATSQWLGGVGLSDSVGAVGVDLFPDGRPDLVITRFGQPNRLLENTGKRLVDRTPSSWTSAWKTQTAALDDTDGDGDLDLFFGNYGELPTSNVCGGSSSSGVWNARELGDPLSSVPSTMGSRNGVSSTGSATRSSGSQSPCSCAVVGAAAS